MNDHGHMSDVKGITPNNFAIVCDILKIQGGDGAPLKRYRKY
jgi:hypothetical protein